MTMSSKEMEHIDYYLLAPQAFVNLVDAMSYMVVAPSIVFYVLQSGGNYTQYGIILSIFSFSSFCFKPILGYWSDASGGKFRMPYLVSIVIASCGGLVYYCASTLPPGRGSVALIFLGRFLGGAGAANQTLGFTYIAQVIPRMHLTKASATLSAMRVIGMATGPALNIFLSGIQGQIKMGSVELTFTPLNSVGLFMFLFNLLGFMVMFLFLEEPSPNTKASRRSTVFPETSTKSKFWKICNAFICLEIVVPLLAVFTLNANFQLTETAMAPAANDALGWGPIGVSTLFGINSLLILMAIITTFILSSKGVSDENLLTIGLIFSLSGYLLMYLFWENPTTSIRFGIPIFLSTVAFPFMSSPARSIFTRVIDSKKELRNSQGTMQAIMSMVVSIAGFSAPGLISSYVLRTPEQVVSSYDHRELTPYALFAPLLSLITLCCFVYVRFAAYHTPTDESETLHTEETTELIPVTDRPDYLEFDAKAEACRRDSVTLMGIPQLRLPTEIIPPKSSRRYSTTGIAGLFPTGTFNDMEENVSRRQTIY